VLIFKFYFFFYIRFCVITINCAHCFVLSMYFIGVSGLRVLPLSISGMDGWTFKMAVVRHLEFCHLCRITLVNMRFCFPPQNCSQIGPSAAELWPQKSGAYRLPGGENHITPRSFVSTQYQLGTKIQRDSPPAYS